MGSSRVSERICLFDILNHYTVCPDSGSVRTAQMNNIITHNPTLNFADCSYHLLLSSANFELLTLMLGLSLSVRKHNAKITYTIRTSYVVVA